LVLVGACGDSVSPTSALRKRVKEGVYFNEVWNKPDPPSNVSLVVFEKKLGKRFDIIHYFFGWGSSFNHALNKNVPSRDLMISWNPGTHIQSISTGGQDAYIIQYATEAKKYGHVVYLRFAAEMNGDWNQYSSAAKDGPSASEFTLAWTRIVDIFRKVGAHNVKFVWCINEDDVPNIDGNHAENYWPGAEWVDILGIDGYNWGSQGKGRGATSWRSFEQIFITPYIRITSRSPTLPIWICEFGTPEREVRDPKGVSKAQWFEDMFRSIRFPRLKAIVYFSADDLPLHRDFRIDSSPQAISGWRDGWLGESVTG